MSFAYNAATFNLNDDSQPMYQSSNKHNKTIKNVKPSMAESIKNQLVLESMDDCSSKLEDFNPPAKPISSGVERTREKSNEELYEPTDNKYSISKGVTTDFTNTNYNQQYSSRYNNHQEDNINKQFINKLEYMIHLLEEQRDIKTGSATEDVILYSFLGVFIIFVLDAFARAGKYTR
jgi:hypothetical protein